LPSASSNCSEASDERIAISPLALTENENEGQGSSRPFIKVDESVESPLFARARVVLTGVA
jgi:hypothetical protein